MKKIYFDRTCISFDSDEAYEDFCSRFNEVNAAGGVLSDRNGKYLMIRRNGKWDLPKGHQEQGEDIRTCAVREVTEETGITPESVGELVCITHHGYFRDGVWHIKHSWWYSMEASSSATVLPQEEEGITEVRWMDSSEVKNALKHSYSSIKEVFLKLL